MRRTINYNDYVDKTMNYLTIEEVIHKPHDRYGWYFKCKCVCGKEKEIRAICIVNNNIKSCSCKKNDWQKTEKCIENARQMGLKNRKHKEVCDYCGIQNHYAKGLCKSCYNRLRNNGYLEYKKEHERNDRKSN